MKRRRAFRHGTVMEKPVYIPDNVGVETIGAAIAYEVAPAEIVKTARSLHKDGRLNLKCIVASDERKNGYFKIWYVFGIPKENKFVIPYIRLKDTVEFPSLTSSIHYAWNPERKIRTLFGLIPKGHIDTRPILLHENWPADRFPLRKDFTWSERPGKAEGTYPFQKITGEGIYEIPVGPVHAGIIEPGHFRFSVAGENIMLLEPRLGYTHKGSEKLFERLPLDGQIRLSEKISGDSSLSHSLAFCQSIERLRGMPVPKRARYLRLIYAELERLANHFGDIGAIMLDAGFNFGGSHGARLREIVMRINQRLTGSRFLRGVNTAGGVTRDIGDEKTGPLADELSRLLEDFSEIIDVAENSPSLLNRLKTTGKLSLQAALDHGVVGIVARSVGMAIDARVDFPYAAYGDLGFDTVATEPGGDVYARFSVRVKEVRSSIQIMLKALRSMPQGPITCPPAEYPFPKNAFTVGMVEGWRGDIVYFVTTDETGRIDRVAPRDPSFVNWSVLEYAAPGNIVPDFPLINKSFNLSYSGNDL